MECNKDEATRAKSIAESKLEQKDFLGAKKFALKAQALYPGLHGISQMLTTLDVYLSAENTTSGEVDWYRVLDANPSDDLDTLRKQYRKLALKLHPDKNKSAGAENAFKLISEAWNLLGDIEKRAAYDRRRGYMGLQQNVRLHTGGPSAPSRPNQQKVSANTGGQSVPSQPSQQKVPRRSKKKDPSAPSRKSQQKVPTRTSGPPPVPSPPSQQNVSTQMGGSSTPSTAYQAFSFASSTTSTLKSQNGSAKVPRTKNPAPPRQRSDTFWTVCSGCNTYFEYLKIYHNQTLLCHSCEKPFLALDKAPPVKFSKSVKPVPWVRQEHPLNNMPSQNDYDSKGNVAAAQKPGAGQNNSNVVQQAQGNLKRSQTESHDSDDVEGCFKKVKLDDGGNKYGMDHYMARGSINFGTGNAFEMGYNGFSGTYSQQTYSREPTPTETRNFLVLKAQKEIQKKLSDSRL